MRPYGLAAGGGPRHPWAGDLLVRRPQLRQGPLLHQRRPASGVPSGGGFPPRRRCRLLRRDDAPPAGRLPDVARGRTHSAPPPPLLPLRPGAARHRGPAGHGPVPCGGLSPAAPDPLGRRADEPHPLHHLAGRQDLAVGGRAPELLQETPRRAGRALNHAAGVLRQLKTPSALRGGLHPDSHVGEASDRRPGRKGTAGRPLRRTSSEVHAALQGSHERRADPPEAQDLLDPRLHSHEPLPGREEGGLKRRGGAAQLLRGPRRLRPPRRRVAGLRHRPDAPTAQDRGGEPGGTARLRGIRRGPEAGWRRRPPDLHPGRAGRVDGPGLLDG